MENTCSERVASIWETFKLSVSQTPKVHFLLFWIAVKFLNCFSYLLSDERRETTCRSVETPPLKCCLMANKNLRTIATKAFHRISDKVLGLDSVILFPMKHRNCVHCIDNTRLPPRAPQTTALTLSFHPCCWS